MSDSSVSETAHVLFITAILGATVFIVVYFAKLLRGASNATGASEGTATNARQKNKNEPAAKGNAKEKNQKSNNNNNKQQQKKKDTKPRWSGMGDKDWYNHPWALMSLKGHDKPILDMDVSGDGKYLITCGEDRTVFIWNLETMANRTSKSLRINIEYDHAMFIRWSSDASTFVIHKVQENAVEVYSTKRRRDGWYTAASKALTFPRAFDEDAVGLGIARNGLYIMTCSTNNKIYLWDLRGESLAKLDTYLMATYCAKVSPCGQYIAASGFAPDVKVWRVTFRANGDYVGVKSAFGLSGHTSGVYDVAFTPNSSAMATVSKDGTWKVFRTNVEFDRGEDPRLVTTGKYECTSSPAKIAIRADALVVCVATGSTFSLYSVKTANKDLTVENVFLGPITAIAFHVTGKYLLVSGDRQVRIYHDQTKPEKSRKSK